jgi:hypothetical protein
MARFNVMKYTDYQKDRYEEYEKGVLSIKLPSWKDFYSVVQKLQDYKDYIWRGQRCDNWPLISKFDRLFPNTTHDERNKVIKTHTDAFKYAIRGRRGQNPSKLDDRECWALGQHYGLNTPLLDWTASPFVAAYFAFFKKGQKVISNDLRDQIKNELTSASIQMLKDELVTYNQTKHRVIYALSKDLVRWGWADIEGGPIKEKFVEFVEPLSDENARLISQNGLFTFSIGPEDIEERVQRCYSKKQDEDRIILIKIKIPNIDRDECLKSLNQMNINHLTLFPDIYGSAKFCNIKLEIDNY